MKKLLLTGLTSATLAIVPVAQSYACSNNGNGHDNDHKISVQHEEHSHDEDHGDKDHKVPTPEPPKQPCTHEADSDNHVHDDHGKGDDKANQDKDQNHDEKQVTDNDHDKKPCDHKVTPSSTPEGGKGAGPIPSQTTPTPTTPAPTAPAPAAAVVTPAASVVPNGAVNAGTGVKVTNPESAALTGMFGALSIVGLGFKRLLKSER